MGVGAGEGEQHAAVPGLTPLSQGALAEIDILPGEQVVYAL